MPRLTAGQLREALATELRHGKPVIRVTSEQDKVRMEHDVPLHPIVCDAIATMLDGQKDEAPAFPFSRFRAWAKDEQVALSRCGKVFQPSDLRKFAEQCGDLIGWDSSNRAYILTRGVSGVDWSHYKHPLPENVYDTYM